MTLLNDKSHATHFKSYASGCLEASVCVRAWVRAFESACARVCECLEASVGGWVCIIMRTLVA